MLVEAVRTHPSKLHGEVGRLAVVHHPRDQVCADAIAGYRPLLRDPEGVLDWTLDRLVDAWEAVAGEEEQVWLGNVRRRYLDLEESEAVGPV